MKRFICMGFCFLLLSTSGWAETFFVSDSVDIDVRTGQGLQFRIIALVRPGDSVETLENSEEGWSKVRLRDGKEGWILSRYLTTERPARPMLLNLQKEYQAIQKKYADSAKLNSTLSEDNRSIKTLLEQKEKELASTNESYERLMSDSSEFLEVKKKLEESNKELTNLKSGYYQLEETASKLRNNQIIKGLLTGVGILLLGFLMGLVSRKKRQKSSLL